MKAILLLVLALISLPSHAAKILSLNVFDQLQGEWEPGFREKRMKALGRWIIRERPDVVVLQEARARAATDAESSDVEGFRKLYPHSFYVHEMTGKDGASYGYWLGSRKKPDATYVDGFSFPGGVERKVQGALWRRFAGGQCLGILHLHLSYQTSEVRVKEAEWVQKWIVGKSMECGRWIVTGDFNADDDTAEIRHLQETG
ncbi:MAG: endonuclease/exonuclease/phosphatase family protein, partial [Bdellovibrionales bacterium]|nr:endonuclease/exonuclease/phosphatase family protein [Bdellovibrionales bacterium]